MHSDIYTDTPSGYVYVCVYIVYISLKVLVEWLPSRKYRLKWPRGYIGRVPVPGKNSHTESADDTGAKDEFQHIVLTNRRRGHFC